MKRKTPETYVTNALIDYLHLNGYIVKKIYNGGVPARCFNSQIIYRKKEEEYKGIPDLMAYNLKKKIFVFIEAKAPKGKLKPEQKEFLGAFNTCTKFKAICAKSIEDLIQNLTF